MEALTMGNISDEARDRQALERANEICDDLEHLAWLGISQRIADDLDIPLPVVLFGPGGDFTKRWPKIVQVLHYWRCRPLLTAVRFTAE